MPWQIPVEATWQDLRYAARGLRRSPGFTAVAVVSLALGIGANTAIFSVINPLMLRSLPVKDPDQLVQVLSQYPGEPRLSSFSWRHYEHFRDHNQSFSELLAVSRARLQVRRGGSEAETIDGEYVSGNFFTMLGIALMKWACAASIRLDEAIPPTWQMSPAASHTRAAAMLFCRPPNLRSLMLIAFAPFAAAT